MAAELLRRACNEGKFTEGSFLDLTVRDALDCIADAHLTIIEEQVKETESVWSAKLVASSAQNAQLRKVLANRSIVTAGSEHASMECDDTSSAVHSITPLSNALAKARRDAASYLVERDVALLEVQQARAAALSARDSATAAVDAVKRSAAEREGKLEEELDRLAVTLREKDAALSALSSSFRDHCTAADAAVRDLAAERDSIAVSSRHLIESEVNSAVVRGYDRGWQSRGEASSAELQALAMAHASAIDAFHDVRLSAADTIGDMLTTFRDTSMKLWAEASRKVSEAHWSCESLRLETHAATSRSRIVCEWASLIGGEVLRETTDAVQKSLIASASAQAFVQRLSAEVEATQDTVADVRMADDRKRAADAARYEAQIERLREDRRVAEQAVEAADARAAAAESSRAAAQSLLSAREGTAVAEVAALRAQVDAAQRAGRVAEMAAAAAVEREVTATRELEVMRTSKHAADSATHTARKAAAYAAHEASECIRRLSRDGHAAVNAELRRMMLNMGDCVTALEARASLVETAVGSVSGSVCSLMSSRGIGGTICQQAVWEDATIVERSDAHAEGSHQFAHLDLLTSQTHSAAGVVSRVTDMLATAAASIEELIFVVNSTERAVAGDFSAAAASLVGRTRASLLAAEAEAQAALAARERAAEVAARGAERQRQYEEAAAVASAAAAAHSKGQHDRLSAAHREQIAKYEARCRESEAEVAAARRDLSAALARERSAVAESNAAQRKAAEAEGAAAILQSTVSKLQSQLATSESSCSSAISAAATAEGRACAAAARRDEAETSALAADQRCLEAEAAARAAMDESVALAARLREVERELAVATAKVYEVSEAAVSHCSRCVEVDIEGLQARDASLVESCEASAAEIAALKATLSAYTSTAENESAMYKARCSAAEAALEAAAEGTAAAERDASARVMAIERRCEAAIARVKDEAAAAAAAARRSAHAESVSALTRAKHAEAALEECSVRVNRLHAKVSKAEQSEAAAAAEVRRLRGSSLVEHFVLNEARTRWMRVSFELSARLEVVLQWARGSLGLVSTSLESRAAALEETRVLDAECSRAFQKLQETEGELRGWKGRAEHLLHVADDAEASAVAARAERDALREVVDVLHARFGHMLEVDCELEAGDVDVAGGAHELHARSPSTGESGEPVSGTSDRDGKDADGLQVVQRDGGDVEVSGLVSLLEVDAEADPRPVASSNRQRSNCVLRVLTQEVRRLKTHVADRDEEVDVLRVRLSVCEGELKKAGDDVSALRATADERSVIISRLEHALATAAKASDEVSQSTRVAAELDSVRAAMQAAEKTHAVQLEKLKQRNRRMEALVKVGAGTRRQRAELKQLVQNVVATSRGAVLEVSEVFRLPTWEALENFRGSAEMRNLLKPNDVARVVEALCGMRSLLAVQAQQLSSALSAFFLEEAAFPGATESEDV